jgi:hypothetical protein
MSWLDNYWLEALEIAMDEMGILDALSAEQRKELAASLATSAENMSLCSPPVSNPLQGELDEVKRQRTAERERREKRERDIIHEIARIHNEDPHRVYFDSHTHRLMVSDR